MNFSTLTASLLNTVEGSRRCGALTLVAVGCVNMALLSTLSNSNIPRGDVFCTILLGPAPSTASGIRRCSAGESRFVNGAEMRPDDTIRCGFFTGGGGNESFLPAREGTADNEELDRSSKNIHIIRYDIKPQEHYRITNNVLIHCAIYTHDIFLQMLVCPLFKIQNSIFNRYNVINGS